jgi:hypothetical protein
MRKSREDRTESERLMFSGEWAIHEAYDIAPGGVVIGRGDRRAWLAPIEHPELPQMVAKLETADDAGTRTFYETYGSLGFLNLTTDWRVHLHTWPDGTRTMGGDPLWWVRAHARTVRLCLELSEALQRKHTASLERLLADPHRGYAVRDRLERVSAASFLRLSHRSMRDAEFQKLSIPLRAQMLRVSLIERNITGIHRSWKVENEWAVHPRFRFAAPIEGVYWHLADVIDGGRVARCKRPGCGAFFIQTHRNQEYCAPRYLQRESPCAIWDRQHRWLKQQRTTRAKRT